MHCVWIWKCVFTLHSTQFEYPLERLSLLPIFLFDLCPMHVITLHIKFSCTCNVCAHPDGISSLDSLGVGVHRASPLHTGLSRSAPIKRVSSPLCQGASASAGHMTQLGQRSSELSRVYLAAETQGLAFHSGPFTGSRLWSLVLCLVCGPDKAAYSFDRWPDFFM